MKRLFIGLLLGLFALLIALPVFAVAVNNPDSMVVDQANIYGDVLESGDWLALITFHLNYAAYPTVSADSTFLIRLLDSTGAEVTSVTAYNNPYFHTGYGYEAASIYLSAADVTSLGLTWAGSYSAQLIGNPGITWSAGIPTSSSNITAWTSSGQTALGTRVLYLATAFQSAWGLTTTPLIRSGALTDDGANYFDSIIPQLRNIVPTIYSSYMTKVVYHERSHGLAYAVTLRSQWVGTWLDLTTAAADWGIDPIWFYGAIWLTLSAVGAIVLQEGTKSNKFTTPFLFLMSMLGTFAGFLSYFFGGIAILIAVLALVNQLAWSKSYD